jgi:hypothetical protein
MSAEIATPPRKWFAVAAAFAIAVAALAFWTEHRRGQPEKPRRVHENEDPVPRPVPPPVSGGTDFQPSPPEKPRPSEPGPPPPEAASPLSSGGGGGQATPNKSVVPPLPSLWSLLFRPWLLGAAAASIAVLGAWQWKRRRRPA